MADVKITALTENTTPLTTDLAVMVDDPGGTPLTQKITLANLRNHTILDGAIHTDSVAQTVSRGSLIYANSTPKWYELVVGAANTVLVSDGTDISWSATPRLANIADTGGTSRITTATSGPHVTLTGVVRTTNNLAVRSTAVTDDTIILNVQPSFTDNVGIFPRDY